MTAAEICVGPPLQGPPHMTGPPRMPGSYFTSSHRAVRSEQVEVQGRIQKALHTAPIMRDLAMHKPYVFAAAAISRLALTAGTSSASPLTRRTSGELFHLTDELR
jgi:hypothetical protein